MDNLWAQAQVQWKANNLTQYGKNCKNSDKIPFYNVTLEDVLEPKNLCVAYESPRFLSGKEMDLPNQSSNNRTGPVSGTNETMQAIKGDKKPTSTVSIKNAKKTHAPKGKGKKPKSKARGPKTSAPKPVPTSKAKGNTTSKPRGKSNSYGKSDKQAKYGEKQTYNPFKRISDWFASNSKNRTASPEPKRAGYAYAVASSKSPEAVSTAVNVTRHHNSSFVSPPNAAIKTNAGSNQISQEDVDELCPERLPTFWLKKQGGDLAKLEKEQDEIQEKCEKLKADIKTGKKIEALPIFDFQKRPWIAKPKPPINPKSTSNRKLKKGKPDASAKTNDGKSSGKTLVTTTNPANSKSTQAAKPAPADSSGRKAANLEAENGTRLESPVAILIALVVAYCTNLMLTA